MVFVHHLRAYFSQYNALQFHPCCRKESRSLFVDWVMMAILNVMKQYLTVVLIHISLIASDAEYPFICLWALCMSSLENCPLKFFAYYLIGLLVFMDRICVNYLYFLEFKPLSKVSLANIFCNTAGSLFILLMCSLAVQQLFILMKAHLFILSFMYLALGDISMKILLCGISEIFLPMSSSRTFMVS